MENLLGIPQSSYGTAAVEAGNIIYGILKKNDLNGVYDRENHHIIILESSDLPIETVKKFFEDDSLYDGYYPRVQPKSDLYDRNIVIQLVPSRGMTSYSRKDQMAQGNFNKLLENLISLMDKHDQKTKREKNKVLEDINKLLSESPSVASLWHKTMGMSLEDYIKPLS